MKSSSRIRLCALHTENLKRQEQLKNPFLIGMNQVRNESILAPRSRFVSAFWLLDSLFKNVRVRQRCASEHFSLATCEPRLPRLETVFMRFDTRCLIADWRLEFAR